MIDKVTIDLPSDKRGKYTVVAHCTRDIVLVVRVNTLSQAQRLSEQLAKAVVLPVVEQA